ncbi:MAG: hypothetical protein WCP34_01865 [Pseudomonadota bacterium]
MRRLLTFVLTLAISFLSVAVSLNANAANQTDSQTSRGDHIALLDHRLLTAGVGAIAGVVVFNMLTYPLGSVPFVAGPLAATPIDIALGSRRLAVFAAGGGALIAHYFYSYYHSPQ